MCELHDNSPCLPDVKIEDITTFLERQVESVGEEIPLWCMSAPTIKKKVARQSWSLNMLLDRKVITRIPKVVFSEVIPVLYAGPAREVELRGLNM